MEAKITNRRFWRRRKTEDRTLTEEDVPWLTWPTAAGVTVINTGSFSPPFGGMVADLAGGRLTVRRIEARRGAFHPGRTVAEFALGRAPTAARPHAA